MDARQLNLSKTTPPSGFTPTRSGLLQRQCNCGGSAGPAGECLDCNKRRKLQTKLLVNEPGDKYEVEADRVADSVLGMTDSDVRRREESAPQVQRKGTCEGGMDAPPIVDNVLRSPGQPLDTATRAYMEPRFGHDFGRVRIHTDAEAAESARSVNALAYTVGDHLVFNSGMYRPRSNSGRSLIAHELTHSIQQGGVGAIQNSGGLFVARQCDPAWAGLPWEDRVTNVKALPNTTAKHQCMTDMIDEALYPNVTVLEKTNSSTTVNAAITAGAYEEWGTLSDMQVNFDNNLTSKTGNPNQFGQSSFTEPAENEIDIYIILGPGALNTIGPQYTRMTFDHEAAHAGDFLIQFATGSPHGATAGEEFTIYEEMFSHYFLDVWDIDNSACSYSIADTFSPLFSYYASATAAERDSGFDSLKMFYEVRIQGIDCNMMKFKIWLQSMMNARPASDAFIARINALPGLGLTRGVNPNTHLDCSKGCS